MRTRFRGITVREGALIEGPAGWGEFSPFAEYGPRECARWLACALEAAVRRLAGAGARPRVGVNVTVPAVGPDRAHQIVAGSGCRTAKVKVAEAGQADADDIARVEAVRDAIGPGGRVRVDANGAWDVEHAARMLRALGRFGLEYAEQPCASLAELAELRRRVDVPLAADESIRRAEDPLAVRAAGAADIVVLKVQPLGGVRAALRVGGGVRPAGGGVQRGGVLGGAGGRGGAGRRAARAALRLRAGHDEPADRGRDRRAAGRRGRHAAGPRRGRRPGAAGGVGIRPGPWIARMLAAAEFLGTGP